MTDGAIELTTEERGQLLQLVDQRFGIRGSDYGASRIDAAVRKVLPTTDCSTVVDLLASVHGAGNPCWLYELVESLTVGETYFLRDPGQIAALRETVLPETITRRTSDRRLRVWSAGCSTGEEVYTLAMLLTERNLPSNWDVVLLGTDVNRESLRVAREAVYPAWSFRATPIAVRERYFEAGEHGWQLKESLRRMARFAWANLGANPLLPPLADVDLIMCRNVTIYFDDAATQRLYQALISALAPGGWLMLGPSDPLPADRAALERIDVSDAVLWRRRGGEALAGSQRPVEVKAIRRTRRRVPAVTPMALVCPEPRMPRPASGAGELEAGLLALESGAAVAAVEALRRATFRDPFSPMAQFALARAYVAVGDGARAHAALVHTRRLLAALAADDLVPGSDALLVETLRQTVATFLEEVSA